VREYWDLKNTLGLREAEEVNQDKNPIGVCLSRERDAEVAVERLATSIFGVCRPRDLAEVV